jgi:hypothetical protein
MITRWEIRRWEFSGARKQKTQPASQILLVVAWILFQTHTAKKVLKTGIRTQGIKQQVRF